MTTIAYKNGIIAFDSRITAGSDIIDDDYNKSVVVDGITFVISGSLSDVGGYVGSHISGKRQEGISSGSWFSVENGNIYRCVVNEEDGFSKMPINKTKHYSLGSGADYALAAMDMGATAAQAVKAAAKRDTYTGGKIRSINTSKARG